VEKSFPEEIRPHFSDRKNNKNKDLQGKEIFVFLPPLGNTLRTAFQRDVKRQLFY
jgi:hypothetical protein